jgi:hypothetical protein
MLPYLVSRYSVVIAFNILAVMHLYRLQQPVVLADPAALAGATSLI